MKKHTWAAAFTACLLAFTAYISLDTFVLPSSYQTNATEIDLSSVKTASQKKQAEAEGGDAADLSASDSTQTAASEDGREETNPSASKGTGSSGNSNDSEGTGDRPDRGSGSESRGKKAPGDSGSGHKKRHDGSGRRGSGGSGGSSGSGGSGGSGGGKPSTASAGTIKNFDEAEAEASAAEVTTDNAGSAQEYQDENIQVTYTQYTTNNTTIHVADVRLSSAEYLKAAFANDTYGKNVTQSTSDIAAANNAVLAINGDYYGVQERGYVIRNGVLYREEAGTNDVLCIYGDGTMKVVDPSTVTAQELVDQGVWQAFSFGPGLIDNGQISVSLSEEVGKAKASNPRTAIGMIDELHYVFVVSDGRTNESEGLSLYELASFMQQLGVKTAYNLDGGGSSTMVFQGEVVNNPASGFRESERGVSDILYIG